MIVDHVRKYGLFCDFKYGFRSSRPTADFLTVVSDGIAKAFNRSGAIRAVASNSISLSNRRLWLVLDAKSSQEYPVNVGVPQGSILGPALFLLHIDDLPNDVVCNIAIYADDTTLYFKCNQASDLW